MKKIHPVRLRKWKQLGWYKCKRDASRRCCTHCEVYCMPWRGCTPPGQPAVYARRRKIFLCDQCHGMVVDDLLALCAEVEK